MPSSRNACEETVGSSATIPPMPVEVARVLDGYPAAARDRLTEVRRLIFEAAAAEGVGPLTETLKWGEPAYLTEASRSGSAIRLGAPKDAPDRCAVYVNCRTTLVDSFRSLFPEELSFGGNRAVLLPLAGPLPEGPLATCLAMALTYHRRRRTGG